MRAEGSQAVPEPDPLEGNSEELLPSEDESHEEVRPHTVRLKVAHRQGGCVSMTDWQKGLANVMTMGKTFRDLGGVLLSRITYLDSPLGEFCHPVQPPPAAEASYDRRGDLLPIHPSSIKVGENKVTEGNIHWVRLTLCMMNFHYCAGWSKRPICVPMDTRLSPNQKVAVKELAITLNDNVVIADPLPSMAEAKKSLQSKKFDYSGNPIEHMQDLVCSKVVPTWPKVGEAGIQCIATFLSGEVREALRDPKQWLLPRDLQPLKSKKSITDSEWFSICEAGFKRGMFTFVDDAEAPRDRSGYLIVNGAGGVKKLKTIGNKVTECQRFISVLIPTNEAMMELPGEQDSLPYIGQLTALRLSESQELYLESEDFQSAFNLFRVPKEWSPYFAYSKKVDGRAFGRPDLGQVRPALQVIPMGWKSAVTLVQAAVRNIVYDRVGVSRSTAVQKNLPIPEGNFLSVVYLDNYDEIQILERVHSELVKEEANPTETHRRFNEVCDELKLPRNSAKQLIGALSGPMQGGEFLVKEDH